MTGNLYDIIAEHYSSIFPPDKDRINFVERFLSPNSHILDTGCATGDLCIALAEKGHKTTGIDLSQEMIETAYKKAEEKKINCTFLHGSMLDIDKHFDSNMIDAILCMGNTLPHLKDTEEISLFFKKAGKILKKSGYFLIQVLNYDRLEKNNITELPVINTDNIKMTRRYKRQKNNSTEFIIELTTEGKTYTEKTTLIPLKQKEIIQLLRKNSFTHIETYSDYKQTPATEESFAILYMAQK
ncbi:class I SAM-dependent methyltransferase [Spirochaetia bacterium 38H-sp]|uniref:Class I SAM-dependent methyltransferase n=1 Tax=Rarispira pelagica TaxID=3141764 RepID=A0ABU9UAZ4_9SPIR